MFKMIAARFLPMLAASAVLCATTGQLDSKEVMLRNKDGKSLAARLITCKGDNLTVLRSSDKKQFELKVSELDDTSRAEVDAWLAAGGGLSERFEIDVRSGKRQRSTGYDYSDEKKVDLEPLIVIKNPEANILTRAVKVTALFLGRPVIDRNAYYVFSTESFNLPSLEGGKEGAFQMKRISRIYDDRGSYKYGARYLGWVVLIQDQEDGRIISSKSVPEPLAGKFGSGFLKLKADATYNDKLKLMENFNTYSY